MKLKNRKTLIWVLAGLFVLLVILYFAVIRPLTAEEEDPGVQLDLLDGEVAINNRLTNFYIFQPLERSSIQSIEVENEYGGYKVYRDATDTFQLAGYAGLNFDPELFSSLVVTSGTPTAMMRVAQDLDEAGFAEYGLDHPQASWTLTSTSGETYTMYVGDELLTEGGYYVKYAPRNAVYIVSTTLADTILKPDYALIQPLLTYGMTQSNIYFVNRFSLWHGDELFINVRLLSDEERNPHSTALVEFRLTTPTPEDETNGRFYDINDDLYLQVLYNFMALEGESVLAFKPTDEQLEAFGLADPAYKVEYNFSDEESGASYDFILKISAALPDGSYNAVSNLYGYNLVVNVSAEKLGWLEYDHFAWIFPTPFFENIVDVSEITLTGDDVNVHYVLTHGVTDEETPTLDVTETVTGTVIPNAEVNNFRQYYKTMLNITNQQYAALSEEDREALLSDENRVRLTMTYDTVYGVHTEFKFYQYYIASDDRISAGKILVVVNGVGEFYTTNDLVDKVVNDTARVLEGLDVDAYGQN